MREPVEGKGKTSLFYATEEQSERISTQLAGPAMQREKPEPWLVQALHGDELERQLWRAEAYDDLERDDDTIRCSTRAIQLAPDDARGYRLRAVGLEAIDKADEALRDLNRAVELEPDEAVNYLCRSILYKAMGNNAQADADRIRAIDLDPSILDAESLDSEN